MKYVISLGGSVINPGKIDIDFLKKFKEIIIEKSKEHQFIIVCGGGSIAREYISAGREFKLNNYKLDVLGIRATELNAELVSSILGVKRSKTIEELSGTISVTNGLFPGITSDFDTAIIAEKVGADVIINISNVKGIYDKDPRKNKDAKLIKKLSIDELIKMANEFELGVGTNFVFDLAAAKIAKRSNIKIIFIKGVDNLRNILEGKNFEGTVVE